VLLHSLVEVVRGEHEHILLLLDVRRHRGGHGGGDEKQPHSESRVTV
jgi:hypothetical protein